MANGIKQPRASIACSRNRDPDYLLLASEGLEGLAAVALFDALLCAAKDQNNGGAFNVPPAVVAALAGIEFKLYSKLIQKLINLGWVLEADGAVVVRSYAKWNPPDHRGGPRPNAGRPSRIGIQNEIKPSPSVINLGLPPSPSPSPLPTTTKTKPRKRGVLGADVVIPDDLKQHETAIRKWFDYRAEIKKPIYDVSLEAAFDKMRAFGGGLREAIDDSIANGWQGLFDHGRAKPRAQAAKVSQEFSRG